jgi:5-oxoprolinase (ATP-hydrolysing) subunit A
MTIDLNADFGEGAGFDAEIVQWVTSVNIACGGHAGDAGTMRAAVALAHAQGAAIGAHPGYEDRENFGRRELGLPLAEIAEQVQAQVARLRDLVPLRHVKPHGALYHRATIDHGAAEAVVRAVSKIDAGLWIYALPGSALQRAAEQMGMQVRAEGFADRRYLQDGTLAGRGVEGAVLSDPTDAAAHAVELVCHGRVRTLDNGELKLVVQTLCVHGDDPAAAARARHVRRALEIRGVTIAAG